MRARRRFYETKRKVKEDFEGFREVDEELKSRVMSKVSWLRANGVNVVTGRLVKELGDVERWEVEYVIQVLIEEGKLEKRGHSIFFAK